MQPEPRTHFDRHPLMEEDEEPMPVPVVVEPSEVSQPPRSSRSSDEIEVEEVVQPSECQDVDETELCSGSGPILLGMPPSMYQQPDEQAPEPGEQPNATHEKAKEEQPESVPDGGHEVVSAVPMEGQREGAVQSASQGEEASADANMGEALDGTDEEQGLEVSTLVSSLRVRSVVQSTGSRDGEGDGTGGEDMVENSAESEIISSFAWESNG